MSPKRQHHSIIPDGFPAKLTAEILEELSRLDTPDPIPGRVRAICRRAAGLALRAAQESAAPGRGTGSAITLLESLAAGGLADDTVAAAAARLRAQRQGDDTSAMSTNPLDDLALLLRYCAAEFARAHSGGGE